MQAGFAWAEPVVVRRAPSRVRDGDDVALADWTIRPAAATTASMIEWRGLSVCEFRGEQIAWWREHHLAPPAPVDVSVRGFLRDRGGAVDLVEELQHHVVERVRRLGHEAVRGAAQHVEARRR